MEIKKLCHVFLFVLFLFQQYIMLHDMVAAHSIVRVSVCRANNGLSMFILFPVQFPAFLKSVFQIKLDRIRSFASVLQQTILFYSHPALEAHTVQQICKRDRLYVTMLGNLCIILHL